MDKPPVCVDASLVLRMLIEEADAPVAQLWSGWQEEGRSVVAPALLWYEVTNALHRYSSHGHLTSQEASELLAVGLELGVCLYDDAEIHHQALRLAQEYSLSSAYDAHYLALALRLGAEFWTSDAKLGHTLGGQMDWVHTVETGRS